MGTMKCSAVAACFVVAVASVAVAGDIKLLWGVDTSGSGAQLVNFNPLTGAESARYNLSTGGTGNHNIGLSGWTDELFYINGDVNPGNVIVIDPDNGSTLRTFSISGGWNVNGLGYFKAAGASSGYLYTSGCVVGDMHRYSAVDGSGPTFFWGDYDVTNAVGGDFGGRIFAPVLGQNLICEASPTADMSVATFPCSFAQQIVGMAYDGVYLYASTTDNKVYTMNPNTGAVQNTISMPYALWGLGSTEGTETPQPSPDIPLPAAAWMGLTLFAGLGAMRGLRTLRRA